MKYAAADRTMYVGNRKNLIIKQHFHVHNEITLILICTGMEVIDIYIFICMINMI